MTHSPHPLDTCSVLAYFADDPSRSYQLAQWLPVLEVLDSVHPVGIVSRNADTAELLAARTSLPVALAHDFVSLTGLYDELPAAVVVYCNNSMLNFQSLLDGRRLHAHINHGESDKQSMASNNAKAYDRVFVAGQAAVDRYRDGLLDFDDSKLVRIGRPQLDLRPASPLVATEWRTVLYAPTWEGDAAYNDYTSLDVFGVQIAEAVLAQDRVRLVYKPHPQIINSRRDDVIGAHRRILKLIEDAAAANPEAGHQALVVGDILAVIPECDAMITDVSSVGLDWLYLRTEKPIFITDKHDDGERLRREVPVSRCADVLDTANIDSLPELLRSRLALDEHHLARVAMRHHYFDDVAVGESTTRFIEAISAMVERHAELTGQTGGTQDAITA